jgi:hypothetical protein
VTVRETFLPARQELRRFFQDVEQFLRAVNPVALRRSRLLNDPLLA